MPPARFVLLLLAVILAAALTVAIAYGTSALSTLGLAGPVILLVAVLLLRRRGKSPR